MAAQTTVADAAVAALANAGISVCFANPGMGRGYFVLTRLLGDRDVRVIPHFFPFTEPSVDVSVSWTDRNGRTDWLEVAGAGMVDPNVFANVGYDPERWTGFAFGFGLDRIAMIRHQISDIRLLYEGDLRFLEQFS